MISSLFSKTPFIPDCEPTCVHTVINYTNNGFQNLQKTLLGICPTNFPHDHAGKTTWEYPKHQSSLFTRVSLPVVIYVVLWLKLFPWKYAYPLFQGVISGERSHQHSLMQGSTKIKNLAWPSTTCISVSLACSYVELAQSPGNSGTRHEKFQSCTTGKLLMYRSIRNSHICSVFIHTLHLSFYFRLQSTNSPSELWISQILCLCI